MDELRKDKDGISNIEAGIRTTAGLGVGYIALNAYRSGYDSIKKNFLGLGLPPEMKRAFTRIWQFSGEFFNKIELDKSLGTNAYLQMLPNETLRDQAMEEVVKKRKTIQDIFNRIDETIMDLRKTIKDDVLNKDILDRYIVEYSQFKNNFFQQAIELNNSLTAPFYGKREAVQQLELENMRHDELRSLNNQLKIFRERAGIIEHETRTLASEVATIKRRANASMVGMVSDNAQSMKESMDIMLKMKENIELHFVNATESIKNRADIRPTSSPVAFPPKPQKTGISSFLEFMRSKQISRKAPHEQIDRYIGAWENLEKIGKVKMGRSNILYISTSGDNTFPSEIGWTLYDWKGDIVDGHHFSVKGWGATPQGLRTTINNHPITQQIDKDEMHKIADALYSTMTHPTAKARGMQVAITNGGKGAQTIENLISFVENKRMVSDGKVGMLRLLTLQSSSIDVTGMPLVNGEPIQLDPKGLFSLIRQHATNQPQEVKDAIIKRLKMIGVNGLTEADQHAFESRTSAAFDGPFMHGLYSHLTWILHKKEYRGQKGLSKIRTELSELRHEGYLPGRLIKGFPAAGLSMRHQLNESAASWINGRIDPGTSNLIGPFPDYKPGLEYRSVASQPVRNLFHKRAWSRIEQQRARLQSIGVQDDGQIFKRVLNEIQVKTLVYIDPGDSMYFPKDEFLLSEKYHRRGNYYDTKSYIVDRGGLAEGVKVGTRYGIGGEGSRGNPSLIGWVGNQPIMFEPRDRQQGGYIVDILDAGDDKLEVIVNHEMKIGWSTPVFGGAGSALIGSRTVEDVVLDKGPGYGAFRLAAYADKNNPGAAMEELFTLAFEHAGTDPNKKMILKNLIKNKFGVDPKDPRNPLLPIWDRATGFMQFDMRDRNFWRDNFRNMDMGDVIEVLAKYNNEVTGLNDPFTASRMIMSRNRPHKLNGLETIQAAMRSYENILSSGQAMEAMVASTIGKETSHNEVKVRAALARKHFESGNTLAALQAIDPGITRPEDAFSRLPALFGFGKVRIKSGKLAWMPLGISRTPLLLKNADVTAGLGRIAHTRQEGAARFGFSFMEALRQLPGSKALYDGAAKGLYEDMALDIHRESATMIARMFPHNYSSYETPVPGFRDISRDSAKAFLNKQLGSWLDLPETRKAGFFKNWTPGQTVYELNGYFMTDKSATLLHGLGHMEWEDAKRTGEAKIVTDYGKLRTSLRAPEDMDAMLRAQKFSIAFGRDARVAVQVPGSTHMAQLHRFIVTEAIEQDYYPIISNTGELAYAESPERAKLRDVLQKFRAGLLPSTEIEEYYKTVGKYVPKLNMATFNSSIQVPIVRNTGTTLFADLPVFNAAVTTKDAMMKVVTNVFGSGDFRKRSFLHSKGILPGEALMVGVDHKALNHAVKGILGTLTDDDLKAMANRALGNIKLGENIGMNPRTHLLKIMAGDIMVEGGRTFSNGERRWAKSMLGTMQNIIDSKVIDDELRKQFLSTVLEGVTPVPTFGIKYPATEQGKFIGDWAYMALARDDDKQRFNMKMGTGTSPLGLVPTGSLLKGHIDADGDFAILMLGKGEKVLRIMRENNFMTSINPLAVVAGTEGGMVNLFNPSTGEFSKIPEAAAKMHAGFNKAATVDSELLTKQLAGKMTVLSENIRGYMNHLIDSGGDKLARDLGQKGMNKINLDVFESSGALTEAILKGKATNSDASITLGNIMDVLRSQNGLMTLRDVANTPDPRTGKLDPKYQKIVQPIAGTSHLFGEDVSIIDLAISMAKEGRGFTPLTEEQILMGRTFQAGMIHGKGGALVHAMANMPLLADISTHFNPLGQEKFMTGIKRQIVNDIGENTWRRASIGMGWLAGAGAVLLAANIFRPDDNQFLGHRPGRGGEDLDWAFTNPEYKMANVLDVPYANPYDKNRTYVSMASPTMQEKMAKLTYRERKDFAIIHESLTADKVRSYSDIGTTRRGKENYRKLLEQYGHR